MATTTWGNPEGTPLPSRPSVTNRLAALNERKAQALQRRHGAVGILTPATTTAEQQHAASITESAATMRAKGYSVSTDTTQGRITLISVDGPRPGRYHFEDADELCDECPAYTTLADYVLACYEQNAE